MKGSAWTAITLAFLIGIFSCSKDNNAALAGKWNVVNDSITSGIGPNVSTDIYNGVTGDYFDFRDDNKLYIKEGTHQDTLSYTIYPDDRILISSFGWTGVLSELDGLSAHHVSIHAPNMINPGGYYDRTVRLSR